jgi:hypothetical protein
LNECAALKQSLKQSQLQLKEILQREKEQAAQLEDIKESVRIKMSVADDLQVLLNQSRA